VFLKWPKIGVSKYIFLSSQLNAIQKLHTLMNFYKLLYLAMIAGFSCVPWFLRIELGNMCNFRLSPSENLVPLSTLALSALNLAYYNISQNQRRQVYL